jgi:hypothetical protein
MEDTTTKVYGKALYLELEQAGNTSVLQLLLTPDMQSPNGSHVPLTLYRRRLTPSKPRTTWNAYSTYDKPKLDADGKFEVIAYKHDAMKIAKERLTFGDKLFSQIIDHGYTLRKSPIVVEVGIDDLDDICAHKTPYKILARITRSRKVLGFADALI